VRETDVVARLGGDEFVVLADNVAAKEAEATLCARILANLRAHNERALAEHRAYTLGLSIGLADAGVGAGGYDLDELLARADARLYQLKTAVGASADG
jgi:diguanylate cyclase (GGDEF)-like protein